MGMMGLWRRWRTLSDRIFVERELWLRSQDRVRYVRISRRSQKAVSAAALLALGWVTFASAGWVWRGYSIDELDTTIEKQNLAYLDLLAEVSDYHAQFSAITRDMEANQEYLLSLLEQDGAVQGDRQGIEENLLTSETERAKVTVARDGLRERLDDFESDLVTIADRNSALEDKVINLKNTLQTTEAERAEVAEAREILGERLQLTESALNETMKSRDALVQQVNDLQNALANSEATRSDLLETQEALRGQIASLESEVALAQTRQEALNFQIGSLESALSESLATAQDLTGERDGLQLQVAGLQSSLDELQTKQQDIVERVAVRAVDSVGQLEALIASTGLDVDQLLASVDGYPANQGGPFVPAEGLLQNDVTQELEVSVAMLDLQIGRWEALNQIVAALPLAKPVENVDITSDFGYRVDPINGRDAMHTGIDFGGPVNTALYSTAPGVVTFAGWRGRYGRVVEIDHGFGIVTRFAHLKKISVKKGQVLEAGAEIGTLGASGRVTGPHLHYEILVDEKPYDPMLFIKAGHDVL